MLFFFNMANPPFPDDCFCSFLIAGLNNATRPSCLGSFCGSFAEFVEWVLVSYGSLLTIGPDDDNTIPTPNPVPNQKPSDCEEQHHQTTSDRTPDFAAMYETAPTGVMEQNIASEQELRVSGQVCELTASSITVGVHVVYLGMEVIPAQTAVTDITFLATFCFDFGEDYCLPHYYTQIRLLLFCLTGPSQPPSHASSPNF